MDSIKLLSQPSRFHQIETTAGGDLKEKAMPIELIGSFRGLTILGPKACHLKELNSVFATHVAYSTSRV